jgi:hypothetical protein
LPIIHRDDFLLAASVFDEPKLASFVAYADLLVTYAPKKLLPKGLSGSPHHVLHYVIVPPGTLDSYYAVNNKIHMARPDPQILFGPFVYQGEIRVQVKSVPNRTGKEETGQTSAAGHAETRDEEAIAAAWEALAETRPRRHWGISRGFFLALVDEFKGLDLVYEPVRKQMTESEIDSLFDLIAASDKLTLEGKAVADFALLAVLEGLATSERGLSHLRTVFGNELVDSVLAKRDTSR